MLIVGSGETTQELFSVWGARGKLAMGISAGLHCLAAFLYTGLLSLWMLWLAVHAADHHRIRLAAAANIVSILSIPMGINYLGCHCLICLLLLKEDAPGKLGRKSGPFLAAGRIRV